MRLLTVLPFLAALLITSSLADECRSYEDCNARESASYTIRRRVYTCRDLQGRADGPRLCTSVLAIRRNCPCTCRRVVNCRAQLWEMLENPAARQEHVIHAPRPPPTQRPQLACLSGDDMVTTLDGLMSVRSLQSNWDTTRVLVMDEQRNLKYSDVRMWLHAVDQDVDVLRVTTEAGKSITLTPDHLLPIVACDGSKPGHKVITADRVRAGMCTLASTPSPSGHVNSVQITAVERRRQKGVYAFTTETGYVILNDIAVSNYAHFAFQSVAHNVFTFLYYVQRYIPGAQLLADNAHHLLAESLLEQTSML